MDNEKLNREELNTPENVKGEKDAGAISANDLFARLKAHIRAVEEEVSEEMAAEQTEEETATAETAVDEQISCGAEQSDTLDRVKALEEAGELIETSKKKPSDSVTDSVKRLIAEMSTSEAGEEIDISQLLADESADKPDEFSAENKGIKPEKEYSVLIEQASDKTNVFDPKELKKGKRFGEKVFEDDEKTGVAEAEQLTFSMTEEDIRQTIQEAEAVIYEREYAETPEDVINGDDISAEDTSDVEDGEDKQDEYDQTDLWIASAFGDEDELKNVYGEEEAQRIETQLDIDVQEYYKDEKKNIVNSHISEEYTPVSDKKEIFASYKKAHKFSILKLFGVFVLLIVALVYENLPAFGGVLPGALNQQNYPVVYILGSLQILVLVCAIAWKELYKGIRSVLTMHPIPESIGAVVVCASALYHIAHCFISETDPKVALYVAPAILCVLAMLIYDYLTLKCEVYSFNVASSKRVKYTINPIEDSGAVLENSAFADYFDGETELSMFKVGKTNFISGFFKRMNEYAKSYASITLLITVSIALGLVFFIIATVINDVKSAFSVGYLAFILTLPFCSLMAYSIPLFRASKKAFEDGSAIIGAAAPEEYSRANILSFNDKDVFPSYGVKVKSIKLYGDNRIDKILYNAASVFKIIGGPLEAVFTTATHDVGSSDTVEIIEIAKDGVEAVIDGAHVFLGKVSYVIEKGIEPITEPGDEELEESGEASIMYMICNDEVAAKLYVRYSIDPDFDYALKKLYKAGICIGIKTFDPNIDDRLLGSKVDITKFPVRILRCNALEEGATVIEEETDSGVVSKSGPRSLLGAFVLCAKVLFANKTNGLIKLFSIIAGGILVAALLVFGKVVSIPSLFVALYHVFWMVPVFIFSKLYV